MRLAAKVKSFLQEVRTELRKVTWTSKKELIESTIVVVVAVIIVAVFLGIIDSLMEFGVFGVLRMLTK